MHFELLFNVGGCRVIFKSRVDVGSTTEPAPAEPETNTVQLSEHVASIIITYNLNQSENHCPDPL